MSNKKPQTPLMKYRRTVLQTLARNYSNAEAKNIELAIYAMCKDLSLNYSNNLADIYAKFGYEKVGHFVHCSAKKDEIIKDITERITKWDSAVYFDMRSKELNENQEIVAGMNIPKGEFMCKSLKCKSMECYYYTEQSRSLDEPSVCHVVCTKCGSRYKF